MNQLLKLPRTAPNILIAQSVTVSATLTDAGGTDWDNAIIIVQFVPGFGTPVTQYTWNGAVFTKRYQFQATGNSFSISLPSNDTILPIDSMWQFTISADPTSPATVLMKYLDSKQGLTVDLSADFTESTPSKNPAPVPAQVIQASSEADALALSAENPSNIYWWV